MLYKHIKIGIHNIGRGQVKNFIYLIIQHKPLAGTYILYGPSRHQNIMH